MTVRFLVSGAVQGVGFRYFVARRAGQLGLAGWAENLSDGRVEVVARGPKEAMDTLETDLRHGPRHARVTDLTREEVSDELVVSNMFTVR